MHPFYRVGRKSATPFARCEAASLGRNFPSSLKRRSRKKPSTPARIHCREENGAKIGLVF